jgi:hypothetical protein
LGAAAGLLTADPLPGQQGSMHDPVLTEQTIEGRPQLPLGRRHPAPKNHRLVSGHIHIVPDARPASTKKRMRICSCPWEVTSTPGPADSYLHHLMLLCGIADCHRGQSSCQKGKKNAKPGRRVLHPYLTYYFTSCSPLSLLVAFVLFVVEDQKNQCVVPTLRLSRDGTGRSTRRHASLTCAPPLKPHG